MGVQSASTLPTVVIDGYAKGSPLNRKPAELLLHCNEVDYYGQYSMCPMQ